VGVALRAARPSDAAFLAWVVLAAGRSHVATSFWDLLLGRPGDPAVRAFLERLLLAPRRSWWHHAHFLVAERDGEPAAALSAFSPDDPEVEAPGAAVGRALAAHGVPEAVAEAGFARAAPFMLCTMEPLHGAWLVENVATHPDHRRLGLVDALLGEVLERGRAAGHALSHLTLFIGNTPAQRAYERRGFRVTRERRDSRFEAAVGCPGLARMECAL
jgi:ribosomal protein S18 acetylase RimI-like enzyme